MIKLMYHKFKGGTMKYFICTYHNNFKWLITDKNGKVLSSPKIFFTTHHLLDFIEAWQSTFYAGDVELKLDPKGYQQFKKDIQYE